MLQWQLPMMCNDIQLSLFLPQKVCDLVTSHTAGHILHVVTKLYIMLVLVVLVMFFYTYIQWSLSLQWYALTTCMSLQFAMTTAYHCSNVVKVIIAYHCKSLSMTNDRKKRNLPYLDLPFRPAPSEPQVITGKKMTRSLSQDPSTLG